MNAANTLKSPTPVIQLLLATVNEWLTRITKLDASTGVDQMRGVAKRFDRTQPQLSAALRRAAAASEAQK